MSSPEIRAYTTDHPHNHHHNISNSPKSKSHRLSITSPLPHLTTLTHAPSVFLGTLHRHERELVINHQARVAKKEANAAIEKYEAGFSHPSPSSTSSPSTSPSSASHSKGAGNAARAAMGAGVTEEDEAEWAAILAARAAATRRSPTLDLEKEMAEERRRKILAEIEAGSRGEL